MAANYVEEGCTLNWTNGTGVAVLSGEPVKFGQAGMAIALVDIDIGGFGSVGTNGVWRLDKTASNINQGDILYWDATLKKCIPFPVINAYFIGNASISALAGDATVEVILKDFAGEVSRKLSLAAIGDETLNAGDFGSGELILSVGNTAAKTIYLPPAADTPQSKLYVKKTSAAAFAITLEPNGSELIDGDANFATIDAQNDWALFVNTGGSWLLLDSKIA